MLIYLFRNCDSSVSVVARPGLDEPKSNSQQWQETFVQKCPDWLWAPPSFLFSGCHQFFARR